MFLVHNHELPFLNRRDELRRLKRFGARPGGSLATVYGRRRCGKSRLLLEAFPEGVYFLADEREPTLQRSALAAEVARLVEGFAEVGYPSWDALLARWWREAPRGTVLILDEFPALVAQDPSLPSVLQRLLDQEKKRGVHLVLCGSSQRMMHGLVLDRTAPLYGRSTEVLPVRPLPAGWIRTALGGSPQDAVLAFSLWGGVPRYWELAVEYDDFWDALRDLVLDPLGVLHEEPLALLLDDLKDPVQSASILQLIGRGCHRMSEIAARLEKPATSLSRPLQRLIDLGLVHRELPFNSEHGKRSLYRLADPFLRFWFRFVAPNRSLLAARQFSPVMRLIQDGLPGHVASVWEDLCRSAVTGAELFGQTWGPALRWWDNQSEVDLVAESLEGSALLVGTVKWEASKSDKRALAELEQVASRIPGASKRRIHLAAWTRTGDLGPDWVMERLI